GTSPGTLSSSGVALLSRRQEPRGGSTRTGLDSRYGPRPALSRSRPFEAALDATRHFAGCRAVCKHDVPAIGCGGHGLAAEDAGKGYPALYGRQDGDTFGRNNNACPRSLADDCRGQGTAGNCRLSCYELGCCRGWFVGPPTCSE